MHVSLHAGSAIKWGTAWGTCYLNNHAEHCDHPLCERMVVSIQVRITGQNVIKMPVK